MDHGVRFAIVIPLYNHAAFVGAAIQSVLNQTRPADEILIIDDGSNDNGFEIASSLLRHHPAASLTRQANSGAPSTLNCAIQDATADYIAVLNSDDLFEPDKLARCEALLHANNRPEMIIGNVKIIDAPGAEITTGIWIDWLRRAHEFFYSVQLLPLSLLHENFAVTSSNMVFGKSLWKRVGGFQPLRYCHDLEFLMSAARNGALYYDHERTHVMYRIHDKNTIREQTDRLYVEFSAVIVSALLEKGGKLMGEKVDISGVAALLRLIRAKNLSEVMLLLTGMYPYYSDRTAFFEAVTAPEVLDFCRHTLHRAEAS